jgi:hydrogenase nickel incorporation protein HypA/HybF
VIKILSIIIKILLISKQNIYNYTKMHELSIALSIVELAEEYAAKEKAREVLEMEIEVGELSGVVIEALEFAMEEAVAGTLCEKARWKIIPVKGEVRCRTCGHLFPSDTLFADCPRCGEAGVELVRGNEMRLRSLLVE